MACVTACPSGVAYGHLLAPFRARSNRVRSRGAVEQISRIAVHQTLPYAGRFRAAARMGKLGRPLRGMLPDAFGAMLGLLPQGMPKSQELPRIAPAVGLRRARVALITGCVQQVLEPEINAATVRVLTRNGVEVVIPEHQGCCGALSIHTGEHAQARTLARGLMSAFPEDVDAIVATAAGCGSGAHEYGMLFAGEEDQARAEEFAERVVDVSVFLQQLGLTMKPALRRPMVAAYHDACHLAHAQKVTREPRQLLGSVQNLTLREVPNGEICCGSAGTYNIEQPEIARALGDQKVANIASTGAEAVITGNIGCIMQIRTHLKNSGHPLPVLHTMEVLDRAYRGL
jgi:glycolate oxidase iron-sulfur subunit